MPAVIALGAALLSHKLLIFLPNTLRKLLRYFHGCRCVQVVANGSHSIHAVNQGVSVRSNDGSEQLSIKTLDVPLVNAGRPNPFYNPADGPDMSEGMSFNIVNNIWGTNYIMWMPYTPEDDPGMASRFVIESEQLEAANVQVA